MTYVFRVFVTVLIIAGAFRCAALADVLLNTPDTVSALIGIGIAVGLTIMTIYCMCEVWKTPLKHLYQFLSNKLES